MIFIYYYTRCAVWMDVERELIKIENDILNFQFYDFPTCEIK